MKRDIAAGVALLLTGVTAGQAALTVDRSRLVFNEGENAISVNVANRSTQNPYLAQAWLEDEQEKKLTGPLMVLPPLQRVEADGKTQVRVQSLPETASLPKDRESVFYFNLREIPPKSEKANVLTLAMQTRMKLFYRPKGLKVDPMLDTVPGTETLTLSRQGGKYILNNSTPYHFTFVEGRSIEKGAGLAGFEPVMVAPKETLTLPAVQYGNTPVLMFVNDFGGQRLLPFSCSGNSCKAGKVIVPALAQADGRTTVAPFRAKEE
ncbi:fimbria/pilus periplasmic chaperone [Kluyvera intermedia]|nr:fimbria/pilus periplasmic chaperone [Kluyvera intermedia]WQD29271.1 fimbria/pilus periplasmic chaperone [Kluyvera intermedia]